MVLQGAMFIELATYIRIFVQNSTTEFVATCSIEMCLDIYVEYTDYR